MIRRAEWLKRIRDKSVNIQLFIEALTFELLMSRKGEKVEWRNLTHEELNGIITDLESENKGLEGVFISLSKKAALPQLIKTSLSEVLVQVNIREKNKDKVVNIYTDLLEELERREGESLIVPDSIVELVGRLLDAPELGEETVIYDPTLHAGSLVLQTAREKGIQNIAGRDSNSEKIRLCKMLAIAYGFTRNLQDLRVGDGSKPVTPRSSDEDKRQYNCITGILFPLQDDSKEMSLLTNIGFHLSTKGQAVIVTGNSILFKERPYEALRKVWLEMNMIDCIIQLPAKTFKQSALPLVIIFLKKGREREGILMMDLTREVGKISKSLTVLSEATLEKAEQSYKNFEGISGFSKVVSHQEIEDNQNILQVSRYIGEEKEAICLESVNTEIEILQHKLRNVQEKIEELLRN